MNGLTAPHSGSVHKQKWGGHLWQGWYFPFSRSHPNPSPALPPKKIGRKQKKAK
jgi:hypothetical protein